MKKLELIIGLFMFFIVFFCLPFLTLNFNQGQHTGIVTAVDQPGIIFKNYQVYFKTDSGSSQEDVYCVNRNNLDIVKALKDSAKTKRVITIDYKGNVTLGLGVCKESEIISIE